MILRCSDLLCLSFPVCLGAVPEDVRVRALAAGRADEDAVSLAPGSFEVGYVAEDGSAHRVALTDAWAVRFEATAPVRRFCSRKAQRHLPGRWWSAKRGARAPRGQSESVAQVLR